MQAVERVGLRLRLRQEQARAGDIVLLFADESEALTHPYLAHAWAERGADLRIEAPGQAKKVAIMGALDATTHELIVHTARNQAQHRLHRALGGDRPPLRSAATQPNDDARRARSR